MMSNPSLGEGSGEGVCPCTPIPGYSRSMGSSSIPVFVNPTAGRGRAGRCIDALSRLLSTEGIEHELIQSQARGDIESRVRHEIDSGATRVIVAGGDGSIHEAANGLLRANHAAALGVISIGTGNDFAKGCELPKNWKDTASSLAQRIRNNAPARCIDVGQMNERYFANGAGIGLDGKINAIFNQSRLPFGTLAYLVAVFQALADGVTTPRVRINCEGISYRGPVILASISNGNWIGGMFQIAPMARNDDSQLELVFAKPAGFCRIMRLLPKLMRGSHIGQPEFVHAPVTSCEISADSPMHSHLDGEVQPMAKAFSISLLAGRLPLL